MQTKFIHVQIYSFVCIIFVGKQLKENIVGPDHITRDVCFMLQKMLHERRQLY